ncbi:hypothetical protein [Amycolatopsis sp. NPDC004079]|uniref:hypothetical protein n=1 Tax=Amycolatopsis sp. NPDC004079 TaxID=3154549 RepID=UPI0033A1B6E7
MTANEHPISDADLDAVLAAAAGRLDDALALALDIPAGLASVTGMPAPRQAAAPAPASANPGERGAAQTTTAARASVSGQLRIAITMIEKFPQDRGKTAKTIARQLTGLGPDLKQLDSQLAQRTIGREDAQRALADAHARLAPLIERAQKACDSELTAPWSLRLILPATLGLLAALSFVFKLDPNPVLVAVLAGAWSGGAGAGMAAVSWRRVREQSVLSAQADRCVRLRTALEELSVAVDRLFDDAEDLSSVPAGSG